MSAASLTALVGFNPERLAQLVVNVMAIAGAFLIGQGATGIAAWLIDRWLTRGKSPAGLKKAARLSGGTTLALLAALVLFGHGVGWTIMGGGADGDENGTPTGTESGKGEGSGIATPTPPQETTPTQHKGGTGNAERLRITLLGGADVRDERFYLIEGDPTPKTFAEVRAELATRKAASSAPLGLEIRFAPNNTLPTSHPAALRLTHLAQTNGVEVTLLAGAQ